MPRLFNIEVFNQSISGDATTPPPYYSSEEHAALLGSADKLVVQVIVMAIKGVTSTVTVLYQNNNTHESELWSDSTASKSVVASSLTALPKVGWLGVESTTDRGAFGRFKVTCDKEMVTVRVIVTGYSN